MAYRPLAVVENVIAGVAMCGQGWQGWIGWALAHLILGHDGCWDCIDSSFFSGWGGVGGVSSIII